MKTLPRIIQGGMGAAVSNWTLARAVSMSGELGVVSGTALATITARRLQDGDAGGHVRRALAHFPEPGVAERVLSAWYRPEGRSANASYTLHPMYTLNSSRELIELTVAANFAEVYLAKEGHEGMVGINLLEKIRLPNLASLYGAMLAGVDCVLMGAGIPLEIPGALDLLAQHQPARLRVPVDGADTGEEYFTVFDPKQVITGTLLALQRPFFIAIIASSLLAMALVKKATGRVDGFVIEAPTAGGHNAPPRGPLTLNEAGEPVYGPKDEVDLARIRELGRPFWLAGGCGSSERLKEAIDDGAQGIQVGTAFAFCEESGFTEEVKRSVLAQVSAGTARVFTDPSASPTGYPFKVASVPESLSERGVYEDRARLCDLGYLREAYKKEDGTLGYRCPSEPVDQYIKKGGNAGQSTQRKCLCNGLSAAAGFAQIQKDGHREHPLVTAGDDLPNLSRYLKPGKSTYSAREVLDELTLTR